MAIKFECKKLEASAELDYSVLIDGIAKSSITENDNDLAKFRLCSRIEDAIKSEKDGFIEIDVADLESIKKKCDDIDKAKAWGRVFNNPQAVGRDIVAFVEYTESLLKK